MQTQAPPKLWKIVELLQTTTEFFQKKSIDNPRLNAELLLCKVLGIQRVDLYVNYDRPISSKELREYHDFVCRRASREPLQYILGQTEFMSLTFMVNPSVLIPRQDTETLVEWVIERFNGRQNLKILDLGTGSGNIAISLAFYLNEPHITAVDISQKALESAQENANLNKVNDCVSFIQCDALDRRFETILNDRFDIIVANPPYIPEQEFMQLEPEVREYEPRIALLDQNNGDTFFSSDL